MFSEENKLGVVIICLLYAMILTTINFSEPAMALEQEIEESEGIIEQGVDAQNDNKEYYCGTVYSVSESTCVIDDMEYHFRSDVQIHGLNGESSNLSSLSDGDVVCFHVDDNGVIYELNITERDRHIPVEPESKKTPGKLYFQGGVWKN